MFLKRRETTQSKTEYLTISLKSQLSNKLRLTFYIADKMGDGMFTSSYFDEFGSNLFSRYSYNEVSFFPTTIYILWSMELMKWGFSKICRGKAMLQIALKTVFLAIQDPWVGLRVKNTEYHHITLTHLRGNSRQERKLYKANYTEASLSRHKDHHAALLRCQHSQ